MQMVEIGDARHRVRIAPDLGGGIAAAEALTEAGPAPLMRPLSDPAEGAFGMACNLLVPFSNRISGGGFEFGGRFHALAPNRSDIPFPIHGDGYQAAWEVQEAAPRSALLTHRGGYGDFDYRAECRYALGADGLSMTLTMVNLGEALPFGGGFHPWFPRRAGTKLRFRAKAAWTATDLQLPRDHVPLADLPEWDFAEGRPLPAAPIDNAFTGWDGRALIEQPELGIALDIAAEAPLDVALVFSPGPEAGFFCFEPVSHPVDAHNLPGRPGLVVLDTGESLTLVTRVDWRPLPAG